MSDDNNESLDEAERRLQAALAEVREKKRLKDLEEKQRREHEDAERLKNEREGPVVVTFKSVKPNNRVEFTFDRLRWDIQNELKYVSGLTYSNKGLTNELGVIEFNYVKGRLPTFKNVTVVLADGFAEAFADLVEGPNYFIDVDLDRKEFKIRVGPFANNFVFNTIANSRRNAGENVWRVPVSDLEQLVDAFKILEKVKFSAKAERYISETITKNNLLDAIALKEDSDIKVDLNGQELKAFQKVGVEYGEATGINFILADEPGLGKTAQALAICKRNEKRTLIVCPASLKTNWVREIEKFTGEKALILAGASPDDSDIVRLLTDKRQFVVVNYDMIARKHEEKTEAIDENGHKVKRERTRWLWCDVLNMAKFEILITDESHYIKNTGSLRSRATRELKMPQHICITGTPVMNRPGELWPLLTLVAPDKFPVEDAFKSRYTHDGNEGRNIPELRKLIKPYMIRRLKKDVVKELPPINRITMFHTLSSEGKKAYDKVLAGVYQVLATYNPKNAGDEQNITTILTEIMRCKQVAADDKIERIADMAMEAYDSAEEDEPNKKVIIFSQFSGAVQKIAKLLGREAVWFDGTIDMKERTRLQDVFQTDDKVKFLVTTMKVAGEGLNLTRAGTILFNDLGWTPAIHEQAEARAYGRISNLHTVNSIYLLAENTLDGWIWELLEAKMRIITEVVEGVQGDREASGSIVKDLIQRLKDMR